MKKWDFFAYVTNSNTVSKCPLNTGVLSTCVPSGYGSTPAATFLALWKNIKSWTILFLLLSKVRLIMGQSTPMTVTKIKKIVVDIQKFPAKIDSLELAKNARDLLKKYAVLSEKIERNVLISSADQKNIAKIRTKEFKALRVSIKEKANEILHAKTNQSVQREKPAKKPVKTTTAKKTSKAAAESVTKEKSSKKPVKKSSPKPPKATNPKEGE